MKYLIILIIASNAFSRDTDQLISQCGEYSFSAFLKCTKSDVSLVISPDSLSKRIINLKKNPEVSTDYFCGKYISGKVLVKSIEQKVFGHLKTIDSTILNKSSKLNLLKGQLCL